MRISDWSSDVCSSDLTALKPTSTPGSPSSPTKESASSDGYATTATSVTLPCLVQSQRPGHEPTPTPPTTGPWSDGRSTTTTPPASRTASLPASYYSTPHHSPRP